MKGKAFLIPAVFLLMIVLASCTGSKGPAGPAGDNLAVIDLQDGVYPSAAYAGTSDAGFSSNVPDSNYGSSVGMWIGGWTAGEAERAVLEFNISGQIPSGAKVKNAYLTLTPLSIDDIGTTVTAYKITGLWLESSTTWNSKFTGTPWTSAGSDYSAAAMSNSIYMNSTSASYMLTLDAATVQAWLDNPSGNYGMLLKSSNETTASDIEIFTKDYSTPAVRPRLTIYYGM